MTVYLDTSVVLSWLLNQEPSIADWGLWQTAYTSEICRVELHRTIDRLRHRPAPPRRRPGRH